MWSMVVKTVRALSRPALMITWILDLFKVQPCLMSLSRLLRCRISSWQGSGGRLFSAQAQSGTLEGMPEFFTNAELLSQATSNIGLARRRDLTFRQDIGLTVEGQRRSLKDLFKVLSRPTWAGGQVN